MNDLCECNSWCRADVTNSYGTNNNGEFLVTNHHENCEHYNDSLIDIWRISFGGANFVTDKKPQIEDLEGEELITKEKMHREVYEQLEEFAGF